MKVTIITCCYNRVGTIRKAIESVLAQTYDKIEYIVVDGGSTDGSREIIDSYQDRIAKKIYEPDRGMYEAINKGIRAATGDIIAVCHSDDQLYASDTVAKMVAEMRRTDADMVYADGVYLRRRSQDREEAARIWKSGELKAWKLKCGWLPLHTTCFIKKSVFDKYGMYDEGYKIAADTLFLMKALKVHGVKTSYLPEYVVKMKMGGLSTDIHRSQEVWKEDIMAFKEVGVRYPQITKLMKVAWKIPQYVKAKIGKYNVKK